jgi:hypothetical protein
VSRFGATAIKSPANRACSAFTLTPPPPTRRPFGSRSFYTALGHNPDLWADPLMVKHVVGGIAWAARAWHKQEVDPQPWFSAHHLPMDGRARQLLEKEGRMLEDDDGVATNDAAYEKDSLYNFQQGEQVGALSGPHSSFVTSFLEFDFDRPTLEHDSIE